MTCVIFRIYWNGPFLWSFLKQFLVMSIQNQCTLANYIISVERLNQYMHVPSEAPEVVEDNRPPPNWPVVGKVDICDLQVFCLF